MRLRRVALLLAALAVWPAIADAQSKPPGDAPIPELPLRGGTVESLVPGGWTIEQRHQADFDLDGRTDALLLIRDTAEQGATPRRILLVALATAQPSGYVRSTAGCGDAAC